MALTLAQVISTFRVQKQFDYINGTITVSDISNWNSIGVTLKGANYPLNNDVLRVNMHIKDPAGNTVFQSPGFTSNNYSNATWNETLNIAYSSSYSLPTDINGKYLNGEYSIVFRFHLQTADGTFEAEVSYKKMICGCDVSCDASKKVEIDVYVDYATAQVIAKDVTAYGSYVSLTRQNTIYPPPSTPYVSQSTAAAVNIYTNALPSKRVVTGTWSAKIVSDVTYSIGDDTIIVCRLQGTKEFKVVADEICKMVCVISKWRSEFYARHKGKKNTSDLERSLALANTDLNLAINAIRCGKDPSEYFTNIYKLLGIDENCLCGCDAEDGTPIVPTSVINGVDGRTPEFRVSGTMFQWKYTDSLAWTNIIDFATLASQGQDGDDGTTLLVNEPAQSGVAELKNTAAGTQVLINRSVPANTLNNNGDALLVYFNVFFTGTGSNTATVTFEVGGAQLFQMSLNAEVRFVNGLITLSRYNNNSVLVQMDYKRGSDLVFFGLSQIGGQLISYAPNVVLSGLSFSLPMPVRVTIDATAPNTAFVPRFIVSHQKIV